MKNKRKTSNLLINRPFQFRFIQLSLLLLVVAYAIMLLVSSWVFGPLLEEMVASGVPQNIRLIAEQLSQTLIIFSILLFLVLACLFIAASLLFSHKIAGPLYNIERSINVMIKNKKLSPIKLRDGDLFASIQERFNTLVTRLDEPNDSDG